MSSVHSAWGVIADSMHEDSNPQTAQVGKLVASEAAGALVQFKTGSSVLGEGAKAAVSGIMDRNPEVSHAIGAEAMSFGLVMGTVAASIAVTLTAPIWIPLGLIYNRINK